jgi:hypothetical protein
MRRLASIGNDKAYARDIRDALDYINVFATTAQGPEKGVLGKFLANGAEAVREIRIGMLKC